jgi:HK97 family phage major capsid protein
MTTATTSAELEAQLVGTDPAKIAADPAGFGKLVKDYVSASGDRIKSEVAEQQQAVLAEMLRDHGATEAKRPNVRPTSRAGDRGQMHNPHALGAQLDGKFDNVGQLFQDLARERQGHVESAQRLGSIRNEFASTIPAEGGFLVPEEFRTELLRTALEGALVRPRARVIPMSVPRINFPMVEDTTHTGALFGGVQAYWSEEYGTLTNSSGKFGRVTLDAQKLTMRTHLPNELVNDSSISVTSYVEQAFPTALRWFEDDAFIRGNGVGKPLGFLDAGNTAAVSVTKETGQAADTIVWENLIKMYARMLPTSIGSAVWIANLDTFPELATMALSVGTGGSAIWLNNGVQGPPLTILGRPVLFTEKAPTLGDAGDINFVDLSYYLIGDRQQMTAMWSEHVEFNTDAVAYRLISRVDGRPWLKNAITPNKGSNTLSPFVKLAARA